MTTIGKGIIQVGILCVFSLIMDKLVDILHIQIPGSILGIFIVFILLQLKIIPLKWVDLGAKWLLAELLLFFIPSAVGIIKYENVLAKSGLSLAFIIFTGTIIVMVCSGLVAKKIAERKS